MKFRSIALLAFLPFLAALAAGCDSPRSALDAQDVSRAARELASLARESSLLVEEIVLESVSANYAWSHQQALQDEAAQITADIHKPTPPALRAQQERIALLAARIETGLDRIGFAYQDGAQLRDLERLFAEAARDADALKDKP